ncbi:hypothetical protein MTR_1g021220 [Medicago truncatula]|uniref:Uncharacterized protein n=1 Tax=Medicago truncatula TaxID=3880 RepID=G7I4J5_MEDTR|nr:hypothetical protein MTR_1g021220 [Medicago truncatula]
MSFSLVCDQPFLVLLTSITLSTPLVFSSLHKSYDHISLIKFPLGTTTPKPEFRDVFISSPRESHKTRPRVERVWFEIKARIEENRLKPLLIKKVKPFIESDLVSWANLMSNMSYTKFRPILPPEALA